MKVVKVMNMHISQKYIYLFAIVVGAIVLFSFLRGPREGFNNYIATGSKKHKKDDSNSTDSNSTDSNSTDSSLDDSNLDDSNSYVAPGGNTVLYNMDTMQAPQSSCKKPKKKKQNWSRNDGPLGIPRSQIPEGDEDLYILKSEVIPPVCPACPNVTVCPNNNKQPPPCPPCARCPEPAFDCKKVPNYSSNNSEYLPRPVLADFSQFGM